MMKKLLVWLLAFTTLFIVTFYSHTTSAKSNYKLRINYVYKHKVAYHVNTSVTRKGVSYDVRRWLRDPYDLTSKKHSYKVNAHTLRVPVKHVKQYIPATLQLNFIYHGKYFKVFNPVLVHGAKGAKLNLAKFVPQHYRLVKHSKYTVTLQNKKLVVPVTK